MEDRTHPSRLSRGRVPATAMGAGLALASLLLGTLVYLTDRPMGSATWIPDVLHVGALIHPAGWSSVFGVWGGNLPSFSHAMAFSLLTGLLLPPRRAAAAWACVFWAGIDALFEVLQHPALARPTAAFLREAFSTLPGLEPLSAYLLHGRFDRLDLVASSLGAATAFYVLQALQRRRRQALAP